MPKRDRRANRPSVKAINPSRLNLAEPTKWNQLESVDGLLNANPDLAKANKENPDLKIEKDGLYWMTEQVLIPANVEGQVSGPAELASNQQVLTAIRREAGPANNTHHAHKTWSELCQRMFDSKAEARRGEELFLLEKAGEIKDLQYQVTYILSEQPKVTITLDFQYKEHDGPGCKWFWVTEDVKGERLTKKRRIAKPRVERDFNVKVAWLKQRYGIEVRLYHDNG